jgi:SAM-dependent methyltransferase
LLSAPLRLARHLRWHLQSWSKDTDRAYHDSLYQAQEYDPFDPGYPGYVTIRRFADHVEPLMPAAGTVLDVGCGPGEITCELARRWPALSFFGIDHSAAAIARATEHAARLGLANVRFAVGDAESLPPGDRYALVTMFDAFHHLERPREFIGWLRAHTSRCVLIEPGGTTLGSWRRAIDVDWLLSDLASIRDRLEAAAGAPSPGLVDGRDEAVTSPDDAPSLVRGEGAVERRYSLDDFETFFEGWTLRIVGTVAGFDDYPPAPHGRSPLRPLVGDVAYALVKGTEELLVRSGRDGGAKHWVVAATTEPDVLEPRRPPPAVDQPARGTGDVSPVKSAFDVRFEHYEGPSRLAAGHEIQAAITLVNTGWDEWRGDGEHPVRASYHWLRPDGRVEVFDGVRTALPRPVGPGDSCRLLVTVRAPATPGRYVLAIDLVKEGVTWFSQAGIPWHTVDLRVVAE